MNGGNGLYDEKINCLAETMLKRTTTRWLGVFARDELPSEEKLLQAQAKSGLHLTFALVFNNQPASEPGQHWLAIFGMAAATAGDGSVAVQNGGGLHIEFFDSYALPPATYSLHTHFERIAHFSQHPLQLPSSALCGHSCLYFLFARSQGYTFAFIITRLAHHSVHHDKHAYLGVCKYITPRTAFLAPCNNRTRPNHHRQFCQIKCSFC